MARPMQTKPVGHLTKEEKAQRKDAEQALKKYPELTESAPSWLDAVAKREWNRIIPLLKQNSPVSDLDTSLIATHCALYSTIISCTKNINENGLVVETKSGLKQSPYYMARNKAIIDIRAIDSQLGLSPISRVRLEVHKAAAEETPKDRFEAMLS